MLGGPGFGKVPCVGLTHIILAGEFSWWHLAGPVIHATLDEAGSPDGSQAALLGRAAVILDMMLRFYVDGDCSGERPITST